jgi:hypothetical protein
LKIPKGKSEAVNRRTDNIMAKRKGQDDLQNNTPNKLTIEQLNPTKTEDELMCSGIVEGTKGEGWGCENDKCSTSMVTCETDIP